MYETLKVILVEDLELAEADIRPEAGRDEIGLDSLAIVELSMVLAKRLSVDISDEQLLDAATVADIVSLLEQQNSHA